MDKSDCKNLNKKENDYSEIKKTETFIKTMDINHNKMEMKSFIKSINNNISENEDKVFEKSFDRLANLQTLLKKESSLKDLYKFYLF